jgi:ribosome-associated protein
MEWTFARAGGPGGQHVNTSSTRASLRVDLTRVEATPAVRERLVATLGPELRVTSQSTRSQWRNRQECLAAAVARIDEAARPPAPPRRPSRPGRAAVERRLDDKKRTSRKKSARRADGWRAGD